MLDFTRSRKPMLALQLTPLIDVAFILIIFFMLTTSFMKIESMEVLLPGVSKDVAQKAASATTAHIYLQDDHRISYGQQPLDKAALSKTLQASLQAAPDQRIMVMVANTVSLQTLVDVMDMVGNAGGRNVFVKAWDGASP